MQSQAKRFFTHLVIILVAIFLVACQAGASTPAPTGEATELDTEAAVSTQAAIDAPDPAGDASSRFDVGWDERAIFRQGLIQAEQEALDGLAVGLVRLTKVTWGDLTCLVS